MSNYDDALFLIENEVNRDCEYYVYSQLRDCIDTIEDDCKLLESENAKLRELAEDMLSCIEIQIAFDHTPEKWMYKEFAGRAQELGIEVDDG